MTPFEDHCRKLHAALYRLCGLPALSPTIADLLAWRTFLEEMKPIAETEGGPFTIADLTAVMAIRTKQRAEGIGWSTRPTKILRDPEPFRDLVLEARRALAIKQRRRQAIPTIQRLPNGTTRLLGSAVPEEEDTPIGDDAAAEFARLKKEAGIR